MLLVSEVNLQVMLLEDISGASNFTTFIESYTFESYFVVFFLIHFCEFSSCSVVCLICSPFDCSSLYCVSN